MEYTIELKDDDEFESKLNDLKSMSNSGINHTLFLEIVNSLHNGCSKFSDRNEFTIEDWISFFKNYDISITDKQLELIFNYLVKYYSYVLLKTGPNKYKQQLEKNIRNDGSNPFYLEIISLKSMQL